MSTVDPAAVPGQKDELDKWNWGACLWTWVWAVGHRRWPHALVGLIVGSFIPIVMNVYFGLKGNKLAWETGAYSSKEELRARERRWAWASLIFVGVLVALAIIGIALTG
jgi:hypothetical protein